MKNFLLTMALASCVMTANADVTLVKIEGNEPTDGTETNYTQEIPTSAEVPDGTVFPIQGFGTVTLGGTADVNFEINTGDKNHLRWYPGGTLVFTPDNGVKFTGFKIKTTTKKFVNEFSASAGTCNSDSENTEVTWTGDSSAPVTITNDGEGTGKMTRIEYFYVTYTAGSGVVTVAVDEKCNVRYYDLNGVEIANPSKGMYIRRVNNNATKVIVK